MSLSDLAALGSFVSGVAVLVSLVYVALQVRQAEKNQQASIRQTRSGRTIDLILWAADSLSDEILTKTPEDLSGADLQRVVMFWRASFYNWEDTFYQHRDGLLSDQALSTITHNLRSVAGGISLRAQWRLQRRTFGPEFVAWLDAIFRETPIAQDGYPESSWRDALAADRAGAPF